MPLRAPSAPDASADLRVRSRCGAVPAHVPAARSYTRTRRGADCPVRTGRPQVLGEVESARVPGTGPRCRFVAGRSPTARQARSSAGQAPKSVVDVRARREPGRSECRSGRRERDRRGRRVVVGQRHRRHERQHSPRLAAARTRSRRRTCEIALGLRRAAPHVAATRAPGAHPSRAPASRCSSGQRGSRAGSRSSTHWLSGVVRSGSRPRTPRLLGRLPLVLRLRRHCRSRAAAPEVIPGPRRGRTRVSCRTPVLRAGPPAHVDVAISRPARGKQSARPASVSEPCCSYLGSTLRRVRDSTRARRRRRPSSVSHARIPAAPNRTRPQQPAARTSRVEGAEEVGRGPRGRWNPNRRPTKRTSHVLRAVRRAMPAVPRRAGRTASRAGRRRTTRRGSMSSSGTRIAAPAASRFACHSARVCLRLAFVAERGPLPG
jgi:hypothetical protein